MDKEVFKKIAFTGHRPNKLGNDYDLKSPLIIWIAHQILHATLPYKDNMEWIVGGALGIDTLAAKIAIKKDIPFTVAVPCENQEKMWPKKSQDTYNDILLKAKEVVIINKLPYHPSLMSLRNEWMVDNCDILIAVFDGTWGGTKNCYDYAEFKSKKIIRIDPNDYHG